MAGLCQAFAISSFISELVIYVIHCADLDSEDEHDRFSQEEEKKSFDLGPYENGSEV